MANLIVLPAAEADYRQAFAYYARQSRRATTSFEAASDVALRRIAEAPQSYPFCDQRHQFYILRRFPYSIVYRIEGGDVVVVAFAHSSRDESYWQGR